MNQHVTGIFTRILYLPFHRFFLLLEKFIDSGLTNQSGALAFCKVVLQILDQSASKLENRETLWRMWSAVVNPLHEHIAKV